MTTLHGFELLRDEQIPELNTRARLFRHAATGAELLSLENEDDNKVFGIAFRTPPPDSSGIAHIMEHSVLNGSRRYPVKEPFVELIKGSLNTFLNAMTYPDKTIYPVASANLQDFYNLIEVYLDAVFYPLLSPYTLQQEGWHFEAEQEGQPPTFKGVVFNEMKGAYSSPDSVLGEKGQQSLFPDTPYGLDSGGDPEVIPELTYEQFVNFHRSYYHPSNARIFFWGDDDPGERLRRMDAWLSDFQASPVQSEVPLQARFDAPRLVEERYDPGEEGEDARTFITLNWLVGEPHSAEESFALELLDQALIGTPASPLRRTLLESGLGEDLAGGGLETDLRQVTYAVGLKGVKEEDAEKIEPLVLDTLRGLVENGLDPQEVAAALNTIEFQLRELNTGSFPRGLLVMLRSLRTWLHGQDPLAQVAFAAPWGKVKELASQPGYLEGLIREKLLDNSHRTTVLLRPDPQLGPERQERERRRLEEAYAGMSAEERQRILEDTRELRRRQETPDSPEALATIPTLRREDLNPHPQFTPSEVEQLGSSRLVWHDLFTNGILYLDVGLDLHNLPGSYLPYTGVFARALLETGAHGQSFVEFLQRIGARTGGIRPMVFNSSVPGMELGQSWLFLRGKAMADQAGELLSVLGDALSGAHLDDRERIRQIALEDRAGLEASLAQAGHRFVNTRLRSGFNEADWASEQIYGVSQLFFLRELLRRIDEEWEMVRADLETIRSLLVNRASLLVNATLDAGAWAQARPQVEHFLDGLPDETVETALWEIVPAGRREGLSFPAQVNFVGQGVDLFSTGYPLHGSAFVIVPHLRASYLWEQVRVQGGAYGGFANFDRASGVLTQLSYRDPNVERTLQVYAGTAEYLKNIRLSEEELTRAIIGAIGDLDAYQLPDARGYGALLRYLTGYTEEQRQRLRDQVLNTTEADFHALGEALETAYAAGPATVVLGPAERLAAVEDLPVKRVL